MDVETELLKYSRTEFKLEDLKKKPPPEGVDPAKLEAYLSDQEFKVRTDRHTCINEVWGYEHAFDITK